MEKRAFSVSRLAMRIALRVTREASYLDVGDIVAFGKYKNKKGRIVKFGTDEKGDPTVEIEPLPKGRKQNQVLKLFKIRRLQKGVPAS